MEQINKEHYIIEGRERLYAPLEKTSIRVISILLGRTLASSKVVDPFPYPRGEFNATHVTATHWSFRFLSTRAYLERSGLPSCRMSARNGRESRCWDYLIVPRGRRHFLLEIEPRGRGIPGIDRSRESILVQRFFRHVVDLLFSDQVHGCVIYRKICAERFRYSFMVIALWFYKTDNEELSFSCCI